ncbi:MULTISPECIES: murein L,D-transpeptidase catalytic domain family protein [Vibrio]|uniref:murein L,D-transpeptidase catalytic domain family protein n=1 Tax=Vibrio TaxID=662 RepID=UPI0014822B1F|nr:MULTISPECIES: murein L,D-transpeptidase catalytic domain family protein [Vibrio]MCS0331585.1 murein L,D-transpeptidase catalytic domain family protein [Vibrio diabolicus]MCZ0739366.1 murein L,D-transpeptidase catalytic domain family protein [Vibrio diabolicus]MDV5033494.1 murein L,D-transpeptidase catalytic domain family protein [Vibrio diabolicus]NNN58074.1 murein L,D-transpeptidase catalytic domain family protein [Vibrio sp. 1-2 (7-a)]
MKNLILLFIWTFLSASPFAFAKQADNEVKSHIPQNQIEQVFKQAKLDGVVDFKLFRDAYIAYKKTPDRKKSVLTIIDYSKPSTEKRFYVVDLDKKKLIYNTYVSHGVNSGKKTATQFSNVVNSRKTSLGTFLTDTTYYGSNGYSLRLDGLSSGLNDKARERYIVVHGADYANPSFIKKNGYLGRSWGCPALPKKLSREIIDTIKGGSVIYASA